MRLMPTMCDADNYAKDDQSYKHICIRKMAASAYGWTLEGLLKQVGNPLPHCLGEVC